LHRHSTLESLYIDDNRLGPVIDPVCFRDLNNLMELSVKENLLRSLDFLWIEKQPGKGMTVQEASPDRPVCLRNQVVRLPSLPNLVHLYAQRNEIATVSVAPQQKLVEVNLEDNLLLEVTDAFVQSFPLVEEVVVLALVLCGWFCFPLGILYSPMLKHTLNSYLLFEP